MKPENLMHMVNHIGQFYESMPDEAEARRDLVVHIKKFWDPRMRRVLLESIDNGKHKLSPLALSAVQEHRAML